MAKKSGAQVAGDLAHLAKALYDIIKAFLNGGWTVAALQLLKHYWPQILALAVALLLIPVIVFCCLPMVLFGFSSSTDTEIASLTAQAGDVSAHYDRYEMYLDEWVEHIQTSVQASGEQDTETTGPTGVTEPKPEIRYEVVILGEKIQKNWFIALHAVTVQNDLNAATEADIRSFAGKCVDYALTPMDENTQMQAHGTEPTVAETEPSTSPTESTAATDPTESTEPTEKEEITMLLEIRYLTPEEIMAACGFTDSDRNWAGLLYSALEGDNTAPQP